jgi:hypothetical protein
MDIDACALSELQALNYVYVQFAEDIEAIAARLRIVKLEDVSGMVILAGDCDLQEVWITGSTRPFDLSAAYTRVH